MLKQGEGASPNCACGCGLPVGWNRGRGWATYVKGHHRAKVVAAERFRDPPFCRCGCGLRVTFQRGVGWRSFAKGHHARVLPRAPHSEKTKQRLREVQRARVAGNRARDEANEGHPVYQTWEYREARKQLVEGRPCLKCGALENVHAHHERPGDDSSLIPLCIVCHPIHHGALRGAKGQQPPHYEKAPLCACGCERPVSWKRVRGWATFCKGHSGAKIGALRHAQAPLCKCGCGETVTFRHGVGWHEYKQGHIRRMHRHLRPGEPLPTS